MLDTTNTAPNDDDLSVRIAELESNISLSSNNRSLYVILGPFLFAGFIFTVFGKMIFEGTPWKEFSGYVPLIGLGTTMYCVFMGAYVYILRASKLNSRKADLAVLRAKQRIFTTPVAGADAGLPPPSYFDRLVNINVTNLEAYYGLVKIHTNNSFMVAIAAGGIGFILILTGLVIGFTSLQNAEKIAYVSAASGIVTEFISGVFFYLYNRTVRQLIAVFK